jgi:hypothetical protein
MIYIRQQNTKKIQKYLSLKLRKQISIILTKPNSRAEIKGKKTTTSKQNQFQNPSKGISVYKIINPM